MTKQEIIAVISNRLAKEVDKSIFYNEDSKEVDKDKSKKIGNNQFRELATICKSAECYEEIELLVKYNTAKAGSVSWGTSMHGTNFGGIVVACMAEIKEKSAEKDVMKNLSLFFGYLYWNARIWTGENGGRR